MPVTPNGTSYTVRTRSSDYGTVYYTAPDSVFGDSDIPAVLYAHGAGGAANQFVTLAAWAGMLNWLMDNGWMVIEGSGGSSQNWGNPTSRLAYAEYLAEVESVEDIGDVVLLGRSMGGLVTAWMYANDTAGRYSGWINNSGVSTMFTEGDGLPSTADYFTPDVIWGAWGTSTRSAFQAAVEAANGAPEQWAGTVWAGKNILCCYGDADTTVPWFPRGARQLRDTWAGQPAIDRAALKSGGDHSGTNGSYHQVAEMSTFLLEATGRTPPPVEPVVVYRGISVYRIGADGGAYPVSILSAAE